MSEDAEREPEHVSVWTEGTRSLADDPVLGPWVEEIGPVRIQRSTDHPFVYLVRAICYQQLAGAAARTIHGRVVDSLGGLVEPSTVLETPETELREAGLSRSKLKAIRDLATRIEGGELDVTELDRQPDDEVVRRLTTVWGIGEWTAQMFLMFRLERRDVWPVGDLGVRQGYAKLHDLDPAPGAKELDPLGEAHRPWRSALAWYCWRVLETELP